MKRFVLCVSAISVAALVVAARTPATAAITDALTATAPSYTGACPTTMAFTGSISGSPGTTFQYSFNRYVNGTQQIQNVGAATIPASGTMSVSDSLSVGSTSTGVNFNQIWVHNVAGGQPDVYSNRPGFSVTCSTLGNLGGRAVLVSIDNPYVSAYQIYPPAPSDISTSGDPSACAAHIANPLVAGLLCQPIAAANKLFILWRCASCPQDVDGFKIYLTDAGGTSKSFLTQTSAGVGATVSVLDVPQNGFVGKCYAVSSYKGARESTLGHRTCIGVTPTLGATKVTLQSVHVRSTMRYDSNVHQGRYSNSPDSLGVGYAYSAEKHFIGDNYYNQITRGAFAFDLSPMIGRPLQEATLHLHVKASRIGPGGANDKSKSCAAELGSGKDAWWNSTAWLESNWGDNPSRTGPNVDVNVTTDVRAWMNGAANYGFVIKGSDENLQAFTQDACVSDYDPPTLTVEYFK